MVNDAGHESGADGPGDGGVAGTSDDGGNCGDDDRIEAGSSVLLLAAADAALEHAHTHLKPAADTTATEVLAVTYSNTPDEWVANWRASVGALPEELAIVAVGEATRSVATASGEAGVRSQGPSASPKLRTVGSPGDLTGVGMAVSEWLADREGDPAIENGAVVSLGSLTVLLDHVTLDRAFQFLHVLSGRVSHAGALGYYYLDPAEHDRRTVATLETLFDAVVEHGDDGWTMRRR